MSDPTEDLNALFEEMAAQPRSDTKLRFHSKWITLAPAA